MTYYLEIKMIGVFPAIINSGEGPISLQIMK
jgi:hypothetical protein